MKRTQIYQAEDGQTFDTAVARQVHEHDIFVKRLCSLTEAEINAALRGDDMLVAEDLERAGNMIAAKRSADGDVKRRKAKATDDEKFAAIGEHLRKVNK